ncbi:MAG: phenylacetate--CoA ligase family protein [Desulfarculus sp.]|nr:MAG: phenylacetate--CoA ligase family protein [Desulfarculus sp.]
MNPTSLHEWLRSRLGLGAAPLTLAALRAYQFARLRETVAWARGQSPFYRERLAGLAADGLHSLADLARLPFTTSADIAENPLRFLCLSQSQVRHVVTLPPASPGDLPRRLYFTDQDLAQTVDFFYCGLSDLVRPGERVLCLFPRGRPGDVADLILSAAQRLGGRGLAPEPGQELAEVLAALGPGPLAVVIGPPVQALLLAELGGESLRPRSAMLSGQRVPPVLAARLRRLWGCPVYSHYGLSEMGLGGGVECAAAQGYHLREADLLVEIVSPASGRPLPAGQEGEIVFTTLSRRAMPLIRYRTGDLSRFLPEPCPCGTTLPLLARVQDRLAGRIELAPGRALSRAALDDALFAVEGLLDFRAVLDKGELVLAISAREPEAPRVLAAAARAVEGIAAVQAPGLRVRVEAAPPRWAAVPSQSKRSLDVGPA